MNENNINGHIFGYDEPQDTQSQTVQTDFTDSQTKSADEKQFGYNYTPPITVKPKKKRKYSAWVIVLCAVLSAVIGASSAAVVFITSKTEDQTINNSVASGDGSTTVINVEEKVGSVIEAVSSKVTPSVVAIVTTAATNSFFGGSNESVGEGSGIVYSADGYIITNYHVIESAVTSSSSKIEVYLSGNTDKGYAASVVGYNITYDLAVIKISAQNLVPIELASVDDLRVGQYVAAIGSPGGIKFMGSVTYGIISGLNRVVSDSSSNTEVRLIQTDAAINPGNSGGALVNTDGKLVGVNSSKIAATEFEGMGFAIPVDTVCEICNSIISKENDPNPYIGITISERYNAATLKELGYPEGAVVKSVTSNGPAYNAGIRSGDIIVEYNGVAIKEYTELTDAISNSTPGNKITVKIYRSGKYYTTSVIVGSNNSQ